MTNRQRGIISLAISTFFFCLMSVFVRLSGDIPSIQKAFFRNFVAAIVVLIVIFHNKKDRPSLKKKNIPLLFMRSLVGTIALICNFYAVDHLILSDATILQKIAPFATIIFSIFILREKPKLVQLSLVLLAFIGAAFVANPAFKGGNSIDYAIAITGGLGSGLAYALVRKLTIEKCNKTIIIAFFSIFSCLFCLPFTFLNYSPMSGIQILYLLLAGISATGGQFAMTNAYSYAPAKEISVFEYLQLIYAAMFSFFLFNERPSLNAVIGYLLVTLAGILVFVYNRKSEAKKNRVKSSVVKVNQ